MNDSKDSRKHISFDTIIDFFKISNFRGILNFDLDQGGSPEEILTLKSNIKTCIGLLEKNGYNRMSSQDYTSFMEYMIKHPTASISNYPII